MADDVRRWTTVGLCDELERVLFGKVGNTWEKATLHRMAAWLNDLAADHDRMAVEQRALGHGEGQRDAIADVNAGLVDDLIKPRLDRLLAEKDREIEALGRALRRARRSEPPLSDAGCDGSPGCACQACAVQRTIERQERAALQPSEEARCSQCGQRFSDRACGPTHAMIAAEREAQ